VADGFNLAHRTRYPDTSRIPDVTDVNQTWWMQVINELDAKLGINESWAGSTIYWGDNMSTKNADTGEKAAMASLTRIQNLGSNGTPDVIFLYGGGNDKAKGVKVGSFDPATVPAAVDLTVTKWDTFADSCVAAIMRMQHYYPDAEIVAMLPTFTSKNTDAVIEGYNSVFAAICRHYGVAYVDLRACGISTHDLPDGTHPDAAGMDYITEAVMDVLMSDCQVEAGEHIVHSVTHNLKDAKSSLSYYKGVSHGKPFVTTITGENLKVTVTMGGTDITALCYANGVVSVENVTGDLVVAASGIPKTIYDDYLQELPEDLCAGTNLWTALEPINLYYTANGWGHNASGSAYSARTFAWSSAAMSLICSNCIPIATRLAVQDLGMALSLEPPSSAVRHRGIRCFTRFRNSPITLFALARFL
jgi:lysophospholipase L1-like esterase